MIAEADDTSASIPLSRAGCRCDNRALHPSSAARQRGTLTCKSWLTEAPFRMLQNNLDPEVAENPARTGGLWRHRPRRARLGLLRRDPETLREAGTTTRPC
jgi:hypothetical protein